ncbi:MAG: hypothetical protein K2X35_23855 [Bryobacteraceae bacterium]|nr:hypothetical protein [Bryobacteraceae bacterium]
MDKAVELQILLDEALEAYRGLIRTLAEIAGGSPDLVEAHRRNLEMIRTMTLGPLRPGALTRLQARLDEELLAYGSRLLPPSIPPETPPRLGPAPRRLMEVLESRRLRPAPCTLLLLPRHAFGRAKAISGPADFVCVWEPGFTAALVDGGAVAAREFAEAAGETSFRLAEVRPGEDSLGELTARLVSYCTAIGPNTGAARSAESRRLQ